MIYQFICPRGESNPHSIARSGFWVHRVYQFRHLGIAPVHRYRMTNFNYLSIGLQSMILEKQEKYC